jgi:hypothetical protein
MFLATNIILFAIDDFIFIKILSNFVVIESLSIWQHYIFIFHFVSVYAPIATSIRWEL